MAPLGRLGCCRPTRFLCALGALTLARAQQVRPPLPGELCPKSLEDRAVTSGTVVRRLRLSSEGECCEACVAQTMQLHGWAEGKAVHHDVMDCEAWTFKRDVLSGLDSRGVCELRRISAIEDGKHRSAIIEWPKSASWQRHSNFRGDCTPVHVDIEGTDLPNMPMTSSGASQQEKDLACCQACTNDPTCEAWSQALEYAEEGGEYCWLRRVTEAVSGATSSVLGAVEGDWRYNATWPLTLYPPGRNLMCAAVVDRRACGPPEAAHVQDLCQSHGCCWDAAKQSCYTTAQRPVVMMHGMGAHVKEYHSVISWFREVLPGLVVKNLNIVPGKRSEWSAMADQLDLVAWDLRLNPLLKDGFNFFAVSQGGLMARAFVAMHNDPPVYNLLTLSAPQAGVQACPYVSKVARPSEGFCSRFGDAVTTYEWQHCAFCDYWVPTDKERFLKKSWLARVNNELPEKDPNIPRRMTSLNKYMATVALQDAVLIPKETAWHMRWPWGKRWTGVVPLEETEEFQNDLVGLRTLKEQGKLVLNSFDGNHAGFNKSWIQATVVPELNNRPSGGVILN